MRHEREILEAGERVFARKGYHHATIEEIAREAEFSVGTIYNFFEGKEALYVSIIREMLESFHEVFESRVLAAESPLEAIDTLIELRIAQFEHHRGLFQVVLESAPASRVDPVGVLPKDCIRFHDLYFRGVCDICERGRRSGVFCDEQPSTSALVFDGIVNAFIVYWARTIEGQLSQVEISNVKRAVFRALGCSGPEAGAATDVKGG